MTAKSHYETLGVPKDASADDIRKAWRKAVRANHPDHGGSTEKTAELNAAYDVLGDANKRATYDAGGPDTEIDPVNLGAMQILFGMLEAALDIDADYVKVLRELVGQHESYVKSELASIRRNRDRVLKKQTHVRAKDAAKPNVFGMFTAFTLKRLEEQIADCENILGYVKRAAELVDNLEYSGPFNGKTAPSHHDAMFEDTVHAFAALGKSNHRSRR